MQLPDNAQQGSDWSNDGVWRCIMDVPLLRLAISVLTCLIRCLSPTGLMLPNW